MRKNELFYFFKSYYKSWKNLRKRIHKWTKQGWSVGNFLRSLPKSRSGYKSCTCFWHSSKPEKNMSRAVSSTSSLKASDVLYSPMAFSEVTFATLISLATRSSSLDCAEDASHMSSWRLSMHLSTSTTNDLASSSLAQALFSSTLSF